MCLFVVIDAVVNVDDVAATAVIVVADAVTMLALVVFVFVDIAIVFVIAVIVVAVVVVVVVVVAAVVVVVAASAADGDSWLLADFALFYALPANIKEDVAISILLWGSKPAGNNTVVKLLLFSTAS